MMKILGIMVLGLLVSRNLLKINIIEFCMPRGPLVIMMIKKSLIKFIIKQLRVSNIH